MKNMRWANRMQPKTFESQIEDIDTEIEDLKHNKDVQACEISNLREKLTDIQLAIRELQLNESNRINKEGNRE